MDIIGKDRVSLDRVDILSIDFPSKSTEAARMMRDKKHKR